MEGGHFLKKEAYPKQPRRKTLVYYLKPAPEHDVGEGGRGVLVMWAVFSLHMLESGRALKPISCRSCLF